jgi:hypothetical protein
MAEFWGTARGRIHSQDAATGAPTHVNSALSLFTMPQWVRFVFQKGNARIDIRFASTILGL